MPESALRVTVAWADGPHQAQERQLALAAGATVAQAIAACGLPASEAGIWGRRCAGDRVLVDGDRVELLRPLRVDPMVARRERFAGQGARATGLFVRRRAGAKPGY